MYLPLFTIKQKGFSYLELLVAVLLFSLGALALVKTSLQQTSAERGLSQELQAQTLLLTLHNRLIINKAYLLQQGNRASYFSYQADSQPCDTALFVDCYKQACSGADLAVLDMQELTCLAFQSGLSVQLTLVEALENLLQIQINLKSNNANCQLFDCALLMRELTI